MLYELRVENLLLMERAELRFAPGLNILTGETGAGKTLLAHALDLLLGGRARSGIVREGAGEAWVEGVFSLPEGVVPGADERIPPDAEELVLARRVWPDGRTRAYVCGRSATVADLRELGSRALAFYGQHEHRKLMVAAAQLEALDAFCGPEQQRHREAAARAHDRVRGLRTRAEDLANRDGARERELDLLAFELEEIERAGPSVQEEVELLAERGRLRHAETLRGTAAAVVAAIAPEEGEGAAALLARAAAELEAAMPHDAALEPLASRLATLRYEAEDVAGELSAYGGAIETLPGRLEEVEERLTTFARLARKHGGGIAEVLEHAARCQSRLNELREAEATLGEVAGELEQAEREQARIADCLREARMAAAPELAAAVRERLADLAMADARFEVVVEPREGGPGPRGADTVEFAIAPNAGLPMGPLREVASGGETSRVMLALLSAAHGETTWDGSAEPTEHHVGEPETREVAQQLPSQSGGLAKSEGFPLIVFDEIDAGVGGRTARAVGEHLRSLAAGRQILCITHLPQVAALAARHFTIVKDGTVVPARTTVAALDGDAVLGELVRMLGAADGDRAARGHARELLRAA